jgi:protein gp37
MGEKTAISWTDHTFNPWWGCIKVSPGCAHCYAETFTHRMGLSIWGPTQRRFFGDKHWAEPLKWNKAAALAGVKRRVFCASMADVFEVFPGLDEQRARLWALVATTPNLEWLILTKRPENISTRIPTDLSYPSSNVRLGVTCEDQANADKRIPKLLEAWQGKNFVSYEPAIGPLHIGRWVRPTGHNFQYSSALDWMICGGESGAGCRPMNLDWARNLKSECYTVGVPFFFKQIGGHPNKRHDPSEWPEDLRVREFPQ